MSKSLCCSPVHSAQLEWKYLEAAFLRNWAVVERVITTAGIPQTDVDEVANEVFLKLHAWHGRVATHKLATLFKTESSVARFLWRCAANAAKQWHRGNQKRLRRTHSGDGGHETSLEELIHDNRGLWGQPSPLEDLIEQEQEELSRETDHDARQKIQCVLKEITSGAGKQLARALIRLGAERSCCFDPGDTLLWVRRYVYSDYPRDFPFKRAEITAALLSREGWTRGQLDLNNRRLKQQFSDALEDYCNHKPVERRKRFGTGGRDSRKSKETGSAVETFEQSRVLRGGWLVPQESRAA